MGSTPAMQEGFKKIGASARRTRPCCSPASPARRELVARDPRQLPGEKPFEPSTARPLPEGLIESELFGHEKAPSPAPPRQTRGFEIASAAPSSRRVGDLPSPPRPSSSAPRRPLLHPHQRHQATHRRRPHRRRHQPRPPRARRRRRLRRPLHRLNVVAITCRRSATARPTSRASSRFLRIRTIPASRFRVALRRSPLRLARQRPRAAQRRRTGLRPSRGVDPPSTCRPSGAARKAPTTRRAARFSAGCRGARGRGLGRSLGEMGAPPDARALEDARIAERREPPAGINRATLRKKMERLSAELSESD